MTHAAMKRAARLVLSVVWLLLGAGLARAEELWFAPPDDKSAEGLRWTVPDFGALFASGAPWERSTSAVRVFALSPYYGAKVSDDELQRITTYLHAHGIALAVGSGAMLADDDCGWRVEGISHIRADGPVRHLKNLGADVKWVMLDAPMNGYDYHGPRACNYSIQETVQRMKVTIAHIRSMYPDVKIGWTQVPDRAGRPLDAWLSELQEETEAYRQVTGTPLDALMLDMDYKLPEWERCVKESAEILHRGGTQAAVFLDAAGGHDVTDQSWMDAARTHINAIITGRFPLDFVIVSSWQRHPQRLLPENDPLALTSLLDYTRAMMTKR